MQPKPAATKPSSSLKEVAASAVQPNTLPPKISGAISSPEFPSLRLSILFPVRGPIMPDHADDERRGRGAWQLWHGVPPPQRWRGRALALALLGGRGWLALGRPAAADLGLHPGLKARVGGRRRGCARRARGD